MTSPGRRETGSFRLGTLLLSTRSITNNQLRSALTAQRLHGCSTPLGQLLVARGLIHPDQLNLALDAQAGLRSRKRHLRAFAAARLAELSGARVVQVARLVRNAARAEYERITTGRGYPAVPRA